MCNPKHHGLTLHCIDFFIGMLKRYGKVRQTSVILTERTNHATVALRDTTDLTDDFRHMVFNHFFDLCGLTVPISTNGITNGITRQHQPHIGVNDLTLFTRFVIDHKRRIVGKTGNNPFLGIVML